MVSIENSTQRQLVGAAIVHFLVVWLASAALTAFALAVLALSGVELTERIGLSLLIQPPLAGLMMAWWRWSPADAPEDVATAIAKGIGAAVLTVWVTVAVILGVRALFPPPDAPADFWGFGAVLGPPLMFGAFAVLTGLVGASIGAAIAKYRAEGHRQQPGASGAA